MTLAEFLNGLSRFGLQMRENAIRTVRALEDSPNVEIVRQTSRQFGQAMRRYSSAKDKDWGITDCASFGIMEEKQLTDAITYDQHFEQAGYRALLR